ncbi:MAG: chromosome segregation protein SMC [Thermoguttaceae bacterium]
MLTAIELYGFKSFADRTRLSFGEGISAIVGPNGSGKSNIVDAIKWVLGEQSVKKLRGSEMTDVIFSGSATRESLGSAEVTLSFANEPKIFDLDVPEVHITRRIYRSGEGEYLINRQVARLKDIKDLLGGTGLGTQAYSIIEQGRVESLLQSSSVQRRAIFEEAAGISRFNAKKQEVQRRLERVDQNLIRLSDIVGEVENQLKNVKSQAGKAQQYRLYTARLQELRIQASLVDWRKNREQLRIVREEMQSLTLAEQESGEQLDHLEKAVLAQNSQLEEMNRQIGRVEGEIVAVRERINSEESTIELHLAQVQQLETEIVQQSRELAELNNRSVDTEEMLRKTQQEIRSARNFHKDVERSYQECLKQTDELTKECEEVQAVFRQLRTELSEQQHQLSRLIGELTGVEARSQTLLQSKGQSAARVKQGEKKAAELTAKCEDLRGHYIELEDSLAYKLEQVETQKRQKNQRVEQLNQQVQELSTLKERLSAISERMSVLEELLRRHEGLSPGVKDVMKQSRIPGSPFRFVYGLVADLFRVDVETAPLIELALGPSSQHIVVSPEPELFRHIERTASQFTGRVGFIWLDSNASEIPWTKGEGFDGRPGILGRADRFVQTDAIFTHLAQRLLGRTWIVDNLHIAKQLYRESDDRTNFLTVNGEYLAADGTIILGPLVGFSGVITRRSELRTLAEQVQIVESQIRDKEITIAVQKSRILEDEKQLEEAAKEYQRTISEKDSHQTALVGLQEQLTQLSSQLEQLREETAMLEEQANEAAREYESVRQEKVELESHIQLLEGELAEKQQIAESKEQLRLEHLRKTTNVKIELAKSEERLDFLTDRVRQFEDHQEERQHLLDDHHKRGKTLKERQDQTLLTILRLESSLALLYVRKETLTQNVKTLHVDRAEIFEKRNFAQNDLKKCQQELGRVRNKLHTRQLEQERLVQEQKVLADRMQEDYGIDLEEFNEAERTGLGKNSDKGMSKSASFGKERADDPQTNRGSTAQNPLDLNQSEQFQIVSEESNEQGAGHRESDRENKNDMDDCGESVPVQQVEMIDPQIEIEELRLKIQKLGGVNLDAIETLEELETRYTTLSNQYQDLLNAKKSIEKIIEKINIDSQRLFEETFEGVKLHFRDLFQHLFGGGHADLILEDENNVLECGIDIVARPPGKELKSVSLLSGGEKTMTCVALLLAFFRFRPNPVCILDEVDAALDEGNIDRFARVIQDFQTATQFLLITHSKKTMSAATTMYGITMQDSGVSTPISVRFVDVGDNGEILKGADQETGEPDMNSGNIIPLFSDSSEQEETSTDRVAA